MKNKFKFILTLFLVICSVFTFTSCDDKEHTHHYTNNVVAPTCIEQGYTTHTCDECGYSFSDNYIPATGHSFEWIVDTPATELTTGIKHEECSVCHAKRNENTIIPKIICQHQNVTHYDEVPATCEANGTKEYWYCNTCHKYFSDMSLQNEITNLNIWKIIPPINHNYIDGQCKNCGEYLRNK